MPSELSSAQYAKRHPLDWYVDQGWETVQLVHAIGFAEELAGNEAVWDPACGYGHIGAALEEWGFGGRIYLSDVVENVAYDDFGQRPRFFPADFLELTAAPDGPCSIICNPPYSYKKGIAEAFVRQALRLASESGGRRVCMLLPIKWLASQARFALFMRDHPPTAVLVLTQRPSMPPGDRIHLMGKRAYRGGVIDYCWIVWDVRAPSAPGETRIVWLPPLAGAA